MVLKNIFRRIQVRESSESKSKLNKSLKSERKKRGNCGLNSKPKQKFKDWKTKRGKCGSNSKLKKVLRLRDKNKKFGVEFITK